MDTLKWFAVGAVGTSILAFAWRVFGRRRLALPDCIDLPAAHSSGVRDVTRLRLIVIHSTEGNTARGAAGWFAHPDSQGSTQLVVDDIECFRTLPDNVQPWGASGGDANPRGLHIELAGFARWTRAEWLEHGPMIEKAAAWIAEWHRRYGIPLTLLQAREVAAGHKGVTTHAEISAAYKVKGGHVDPGPGFPMDRLLDLARRE